MRFAVATTFVGLLDGKTHTYTGLTVTNAVSKEEAKGLAIEERWNYLKNQGDHVGYSLHVVVAVEILPESPIDSSKEIWIP